MIVVSAVGKALDAEERLHVCFKIITSMMGAQSTLNVTCSILDICLR